MRHYGRAPGSAPNPPRSDNVSRRHSAARARYACGSRPVGAASAAGSHDALPYPPTRRLNAPPDPSSFTSCHHAFAPHVPLARPRLSSAAAADIPRRRHRRQLQIHCVVCAALLLYHRHISTRHSWAHRAAICVTARRRVTASRPSPAPCTVYIFGAGPPRALDDVEWLRHVLSGRLYATSAPPLSDVSTTRPIRPQGALPPRPAGHDDPRHHCVPDAVPLAILLAIYGIWMRNETKRSDDGHSALPPFSLNLWHLWPRAGWVVDRNIGRPQQTRSRSGDPRSYLICTALRTLNWPSARIRVWIPTS